MAELRVTVATAGRHRDVLIRSGSGCRWQQVLDADPLIPDRLFAGDQPIDPGAVVGVPPLVHGALLCTEPALALPHHLLELRVVAGSDCGLSVPLGAEDVVVGRGAGAGLRLSDGGVSRRHVTVRLSAGFVTVTDLGSTNGCLVDGKRIGPYAESALNVGCHLIVGGTRILLSRNGTATTRPEPPPPVAVTIAVPQAPETPDRRSLPILLAAAPLAVSGIAALLLHNPMFLVFAFLSPVLVLSQYLSDRRGGSRNHRRALARHAAAVSAADKAVAMALEHERTVRERRSPPLGEVMAAAAARAGARDSNHGLRVRLGSGSLASKVVRRRDTGPASDTTDPEPLPDAPVDLDLTTTGPILVTGPQRHRVAQAIALQLAACYPPAQVRLLVRCRPRDRDRWEWLRMLPHVLADPSGTPAIGSAPAASTALDGPAVQIVDDDAIDLPAGTLGLVLRPEGRPAEGSICIQTTYDAHATVHQLPGLLGPVRLDLAAPGAAERCVRALAASVRATTRAIPTVVSLGDLYHAELGADIGKAVDVQRLWEDCSDRVLLGRTPTGTAALQLPADGPHALVAGTTGSGKSALLQTLLVSWALRQPAERLSFVLVDYKGGAAFAACAQLPHTVGLVTDLDAGLTSRALTSLQAEIRRREQLLSSVGAADFTTYQRLAPATPLARLVIVIDEFRALADELPQFVQGLVRVAAVGRSLGIHLILATQRPAGIVSADIRANVDVRIALRTTDRGDSQDILGSDAAARLDPSTPGRAIVQIAGDAGTTMQIARVTTTARGAPVVRAIDPVSGSPVAPPDAEDDLTTVVDAICRAAATRGAAPPHRPWLPPLPSAVSAQPEADGSVVLGLVDLPERQLQEPATWSIGDGNLLIVGGPASGRTTALISIAMASTTPVYFLGSIKLAVLQSISHIGAAVTFDEPARLARLFDWLDERVASGADVPVRLLVDDWDGLQDRADPSSMAALDRILRIMRDGPRAGVVVAAAGGRAVVSGRVSALARRRICMTAAGSDDLVLLGVRPDRVPSLRVPGRGVLLPERHEIQCALPGTPPADAVRAVRFDPLPEHVDAAALPPAAFGYGLDGPLGWHPDDRTVLIAGPLGSGRSTALATMAAQFERQAVPCYGTDGDAMAISEWAAEHPGGVVLVDDVERFTGSAVEHILLSLNGVRLIATTTTEVAVSAFTGLIAALRRSGTGLLLQPGRRNGEVFGATLPTSYDEGPGSGVLVRRGRINQVRIARYQAGPGDLL